MTFVVTEGRLAAVGESNGPGWWGGYAGSRSIRLSHEYSATYGQMYRVQPALRTVVDFLARNLASLGLHTFERVDDLDRRRLRPGEHDVPSLLEDPNGDTTAYRFWHSMVSDKAIFDVAYALKGRGEDGRTRVLRRISPRRVQPLDGDWFRVDKFRIKGARGHLDVDREDLFILDGYDPDAETGSVSPIETLRSILAEEFHATVYRQELWMRGARVAGVITRPPEAPEWSPKARARFAREWNAQYADGGANAGGTPILEDGMQWHPGGVTPKEAQYVESRKLTREETAAAYHIPLPMVGILDHATFSNITEQHKQLYQDTLGPWCEDIQQQTELQIVRDLVGTDRRVYVEFNIAAKLAGSFEEQAAVLASAVGRPWMTPDEARARLNLPQLGGNAAVLLDPLNMGNVSDGDDQVDDEPVEGEVEGQGKAGRRPVRREQRKAYVSDTLAQQHVATIRAFFERQERSVRSRAGAKSRAGRKATTAELFDTARWNRELSGDLLALASAAADEVAAATLDSLGIDPTAFSIERAEGFLAAQTTRVAEATNAVTEQQIAAAVEADDDLDLALAAIFATAIAARALSLGRAQATAISGFATVEAGKQAELGEATKTWVTGVNPRPSHAAMNGETVPLDAKFSNGAEWPADAVNLDVDEVAGCNCSIIVTPGA